MKYQLAQHVSFTEVDDEAVLLDLDSGAYYGLNHIGTQLLQELKHERSIDHAIRIIAEQYQTPNATVATDIQELLEQLLELKLLEIRV